MLHLSGRKHLIKRLQQYEEGLSDEMVLLNSPSPQSVVTDSCHDDEIHNSMEKAKVLDVAIAVATAVIVPVEPLASHDIGDNRSSCSSRSSSNGTAPISKRHAL